MTKAQCKLVTDAEVTNYIAIIATIFGNKYKSVGYDEFNAIGLAAACHQAMRYIPDKDATFITYITPYVVGEMIYHVRKFVEGMYHDKKEMFFSEICSIEEFKHCGRDGKETVNTEEILSAEFIDEDERQDRIHERVEYVMSQLTAEERELIMIRYGFMDNHGEAIDEYIEKHKMSLPTFYRKAETIKVKMTKISKKAN